MAKSRQHIRTQKTGNEHVWRRRSLLYGQPPQKKKLKMSQHVAARLAADFQSYKSMFSCFLSEDGLNEGGKRREGDGSWRGAAATQAPGLRSLEDKQIDFSTNLKLSGKVFARGHSDGVVSFVFHFLNDVFIFTCLRARSFQELNSTCTTGSSNLSPDG